MIDCESGPWVIKAHVGKKLAQNRYLTL